MAAFNLVTFIQQTFARAPLPDHPFRSIEDARKHLALLPEDDAEASLAELTRWTASMNQTETFTPGRRARVLMMMDDAARLHWRALGARYLAPQGRPTESRDGDPAILRAMYDSAFEFANGFAITLDESEQNSHWVTQNQARLMIRSMRWLGRRLALAHMLSVPHTTAVWELLHRRRELAAVRGLAATSMPAFEGVKRNTSVNREYLRSLLLELASPDTLRPRQTELVYRIAARVATMAKIESAPTDETAFSVIPTGSSRPIPVDRLKPGGAGPLYINTVNCLPRLRAALERDMGRDPGDEDTLYGRGFTLRERSAMLNRLLEYWGLNPPQRRNRRIPVALAARVLNGFDQVLGVVPVLEAPQMKAKGEKRSTLRMELDQTTKSLKRAKVRAARVGPARVLDASAGGLGLAIRRGDAAWAKHGMLVAVLIEPGKDWFVGVLRRIFSVDEEIRLGIQILAAKPRKVLLYSQAFRDNMVWEEAVVADKTFGENYRYCVLLEPQNLPLIATDLLLPPGMARQGMQFDVPMPGGKQRIAISRLPFENEYFQRALLEPLGVTRD